MPVAHPSKLTILPAGVGNITGGHIVLTHNCPLLPELTSSKHSRVCCSWSLIAIHPGCPKLLQCTLWRIYCSLNSSKYHPRAKMVWHGWPGLPALDLPIALTPRQEPCLLCRSQIAGCLLHHGKLRQPCPLPQSTSTASPKRDPSYTSW